MAVATKQVITQTVKTVLSPQQIQTMKLLQIPTSELDQRIQEELEVNPALEREDDEREASVDIELEDSFGDNEADVDTDSVESELETLERETSEEYADEETEPLADENSTIDDEFMSIFVEDDPNTYGAHGGDYDHSEEEKIIPIKFEKTFHEYLEEQLGLQKLDSERERIIALQIIGSIDDDGYLRRDLDAMASDLLFSQNIHTTREELEAILHIIQQFDPPGIGARDLRECLLIQLRHKLHSEQDAPSAKEKQAIQAAIKILEAHFEEFSKKHYAKLARYLGISEEDLKPIIAEVLKLNPKPASSFSSGGEIVHNYIVPDFIVTNRDGELELSLNARNAPELRISDHYREMLRAFHHQNGNGKHLSKQHKDAFLFIKQKIDSARWFIDAIKQRQQTMMLTMDAILRHQRDYFMTGDEKRIRPMILKDIADATGLDISTVSRVANSKYVQTEFGTKRLKDFFSESLQTQEGDEVSTLEVKKILSELISQESKQRPLSDEKLKEILLKKGYNIARRTVAKYREQLGIPVARLRKEL
ncbi:MAG: RNA polymerase factor sigma-54 [Saprospiraceae bacterium]|nr:RNA polymerase factor sigma-54 [Saprospiraceae bacterium]MDW8228753.1 RNA polymerase factor sigma-54 [Saprospiraceae bacterium]